MEFDNDFKSRMGLSTPYFVPAIARYSSSSVSYLEGVVVLHRDFGHTDNCILMIASRGAICTTGFSAIAYCTKTSSDDVVVLDVQIYDSSSTEVKILF